MSNVIRVSASQLEDSRRAVADPTWAERRHQAAKGTLGSVVTALPAGSVTLPWGREVFFMVNGTYYTPLPTGFQITSPPVGLKLLELPRGATSIEIGGESRRYLDGVTYAKRENYWIVVGVQRTP
ncbi:MAG: DUF6515 family protein [Pseudomonadota bacterium]